MYDRIEIPDELAKELWDKLASFTDGLSQPEQEAIAAIIYQAAQWAENNQVSGYFWPIGLVSQSAGQHPNVVRTQDKSYQAAIKNIKA
jgi:hypothetical protein